MENFSAYGLPATSNLFTLDGMYDNDPFSSVDNGGATNLLLGNNEIQEVTVVNNGYSGQYGGFAGAYVNYVSKSGTNNLHGNAVYWWNSQVMNANDWFNKNFPPGTRPHQDRSSMRTSMPRQQVDPSSGTKVSSTSIVRASG